MDNYTIMIPSYSVGARAYDEIPVRCRLYGTKAVVIGGTKAMRAAGGKIRAASEKGGIRITDFVLYGTDCTFEAAMLLAKVPAVKEADMIFAVGGGKAVDTAKLVSISLKKPYFSFPTIASNCAASSSLSIVYNTDGSFRDFVHFLDSARHVFVDTDIIAEAPRQYLWAGIGDTYAKYYEVSVSARGEELPHYQAMGVTLSRMCMETVLRYGQKALLENDQGKAGEAIRECALSIIITTGWVSMLVSRDHRMDYNGGAAHAMYYSLCSLPGFEQTHIHGVVVSLGVLLLLLIDGQEEEYERLADFNRTIGLPVTLSDIGIGMAEMEQICTIMPGDEDLEHYPYRLTGEMILTAAQRLCPQVP